MEDEDKNFISIKNKIKNINYLKMKFWLPIIALLCLVSYSIVDKKKVIYLIRHGETIFNTDPISRVRGRINVPLNDMGIAHCKAARDFLANEKIVKYIIVQFQELNNQLNVLQNNIVLK
jgi:hypothetical protein